MPDDRLSTVGQADRFENSPIAWFAELLIAREEGNFRHATESQDKLESLGWSVRYRRPRTNRKAVAQ